MKHRKLLSVALALLLALSLCTPAFAAEDEILTRGEFISALFELNGVTDVAADRADFSDVPADSALAPAIRWAVENGIVNGYGDGRFGPGDPVTREQMATMLYRCAQALGQGFQGMWYFLLDYPDAAEISDWADEAMHWCVMNGIIVGTDRGLEPKATATDDQLAIVLERWQDALNQGEESASGWTRAGFFADESMNMLSITWMDDIDEPGWYVGCMLGEDLMEDSWGGTLQEDGNTLRGVLASSGEKDDLSVTLSEEGTDGVLLTVEGGGTYHFTPYEMPEAAIFVTINTEGWGSIGYAEGEEVPEIDTDYPFQSAQINLAEPATYTFVACPDAGYLFVKWTKDGEDFSTEPVITVLLDESADFIAVFEEDPDWQNPVMNFIGEYQCGRAHALVQCFGKEDAWITIEWGSSAWELARWDIIGRLDLDTLTVEYSGCTKQIVTYDDNGEVVSQEPEYEDGSGTIVFNNDGTFTWHEDQSVYGTEMVFKWIPVTD